MLRINQNLLLRTNIQPNSTSLGTWNGISFASLKAHVLTQMGYLPDEQYTINITVLVKFVTIFKKICSSTQQGIVISCLHGCLSFIRAGRREITHFKGKILSFCLKKVENTNICWNLGPKGNVVEWQHYYSKNASLSHLYLPQRMHH